MPSFVIPAPLATEQARKLWNDYTMEIALLGIFNLVYRDQYHLLELQQRIFN